MNLVENVIRQLKLRGQGASIRTFVKNMGLGTARSNKDLAALVSSHVESGRLQESALVEFFHSVTLFCNKKVFVLKAALSNPAVLGVAAPAGASLTPHIGAKAKRPAGSSSQRLPGYYAGVHQPSATPLAHILVTSRPVEEVEELDESALTATARTKHAGQRFRAARDVSIQCFDVVVEVAGRTLLLVDSPPKIDADVLSSDIDKYKAKLAVDARPFEDLWVAVDGIYRKPNEGFIGHIKFMSNQRSNQVGTLGKGSIKDYRQLPYHVAGSAAGVVEVYAVGVSWVEQAGTAYASLPGTQRHLLRSQVGGFMYPPLEYFETPHPMIRALFEHASSRVISYL